MLKPLPALIRRLLQPLAAQSFSPLGRKLLESQEGIVQLLLLRGWQGVVQMLIPPGLIALLRGHLLPSGDALADFLLPFGR